MLDGITSLLYSLKYSLLKALSHHLHCTQLLFVAYLINKKKKIENNQNLTEIQKADEMQRYYLRNLSFEDILYNIWISFVDVSSTQSTITVQGPQQKSIAG